ncbi:hypothetical protein EUX98_g1457 [Antrodiella citrinella]|uniref:F-box domain-containing protein n=1 Tax=Antrodiella citrinella TaxID=2447956 RepID=A0A4S4N1H1_9APHY|nr:hypothetical protein EUX98_g1457 [Antrodiella citrinella]
MSLSDQLPPLPKLSPSLAASLPMIRLLDLPLELLIEILSYLGHKDLLKSRLVCREIYNTIKYSVELSYYIELAADDMVDGLEGRGRWTSQPATNFSKTAAADGARWNGRSA